MASSDTPVRFSAATNLFAVLRLPAALHCYSPIRNHDWWPIRNEPLTVNDFELEHGLQSERQAYNERSFAEVAKRGQIVRGEHNGFSDFFVPVFDSDRKQVATLVTGPFARSHPSSAELVERWRRLTGRQGHLGDPEFVSYLSVCLGMLTLTDKQVAAFERLLVRVAEMMGGAGKLSETTFETYEMLPEVERARDAQKMWDVVKTMLDERSPHVWRNAYRSWELGRVGLSRTPDHVLVALSLGTRDALDAVERVVLMDAFQRSSVELARKLGDVLSGQVGDHGVVFLSASPGSASRKRQRALDLSERMQSLARRRFGIALHFGISTSESTPLNKTYWAALRAAEAALTSGQRLLFAEEMAQEAPRSLQTLRKELALDLEQRPTLLAARFDRYLEAVAAKSGYALDVARGHLGVVFEMLAETPRKGGNLDAKGELSLNEAVSRAAVAARTITELLAVYRRGVADLAEAVQKPVSARHDRGLRAALQHIREHYAEPLDLEGLARIAGFNPSYFSELFKKHEGVSFQEYVARFRLDQAKNLLAGTDLRIARVAELAGFRSLSYFSRAFQRAFTQTPGEFRIEAQKHAFPPKRARNTRRRTR